MTNILFSIAYVAGTFLLVAFSYWCARNTVRHQADGGANVARAHRIVMDLAKAHRMPDDLRKAKEIRRLRDAIQQYCTDANTSVDEVVQMDGAEVLSFSKVKALSNGRQAC